VARIVPVEGRARKRLVKLHRWDDDARVRVRVLIILLLGAGCSWDTMTEIAGCSTKTIAHWTGAFQQGRADALMTPPPGRAAGWMPGWVSPMVGWVLEKTSRDFGFVRIRLCCATVCVVLGMAEGAGQRPECWALAASVRLGLAQGPTGASSQRSRPAARCAFFAAPFAGSSGG